MKMPQRGIWSVTVPGAVAGWDALHKRFGRTKWAELLRPGHILRGRRISSQRVGEPVVERGFDTDGVADACERRKLYLAGGKAPQPGDWFTQPRPRRHVPLDRRGGQGRLYKGSIAKRDPGDFEGAGRHVHGRRIWPSSSPSGSTRSRPTTGDGESPNCRRTAKGSRPGDVQHHGAISAWGVWPGIRQGAAA